MIRPYLREFPKQAFVAIGTALFTVALGLSETVPTPESVLGHKPGDDFYLASYDDARDYFRKVAEASNRIKLINVGKTTRGTEWEVAIISAPETHQSRTLQRHFAAVGIWPRLERSDRPRSGP